MCVPEGLLEWKEEAEGNAAKRGCMKNSNKIHFERLLKYQELFKLHLSSVVCNANFMLIDNLSSLIETTNFNVAFC